MSKIFSTFRRVVWSSVLAVLLFLGSLYAVHLGDNLLTLALAIGGNTFALLALRASR